MKILILTRRMQMFVSRRFSLLRTLAFPADTWTTVRVATVACAVTLLLRLGQDRWLLDFVDRRSVAGRSADHVRIARIVKVTDIVLQTGKPVLRSECLTRSLVLAYLLRGQGFAVAIEFGVSNEQQSFTSHCWLVHEDAPVFEDENPRTAFNVIHRIGGNQP